MDKVTVYEPNMRSKMGFIGSWLLMMRNIYDYRELIYQLFKRDFLMAYKKSFLGMGWLILAPIMGIISWVFMNATGVLAPGDVGIPYPAYILISTTIFGLFSGFFQVATATLSSASGFILQVNFPHDILLIKQALQQLVNFLITFGITIIVLLFFGVYPSWTLVLLPLFILPLFFLGSSIGLLTSIITVVAPDINRGIGFFMGLLLYITPVIYSPKIDNPILQTVIRWNPLTYLVGGMRDAIIYGHIDHIERYLISAVITFFIFLISWRIFFVTEQKIIEKMI
jgi:lipopolysaccharide transport system permease protein